MIFQGRTQNNIAQLLAIMAVGLVVILCCPGPAAGYVNRNIANPSGLGTSINTLSETMEEVVGNYTIAQFNANSHTYNHTFELSDGYGNDLDRLISVTLTSGVSGIDLVTNFNKAVGTSGFGNDRFVAEWIYRDLFEVACGY